jgi:heme exporter protein D
VNWGSAEAFFSMGGDGLYVWGSYAATALLMLLEPVLARRRHAQAIQDARDADSDQAE